MTFGYDYTKIRTIHDSVFLNFDFNNVPTSDPQKVSATGHPFASFLLGLPNGAGRITGEADLDIDQQLHHLWFQDDFKVNSKLTLNLGLAVGVQRVASSSSRTYGRLRSDLGQILLDRRKPHHR